MLEMAAAQLAVEGQTGSHARFVQQDLTVGHIHIRQGTALARAGPGQVLDQVLQLSGNGATVDQGDMQGHAGQMDAADLARPVPEVHLQVVDGQVGRAGRTDPQPAAEPRPSQLVHDDGGRDPLAAEIRLHGYGGQMPAHEIEAHPDDHQTATAQAEDLRPANGAACRSGSAPGLDLFLIHSVAGSTVSGLRHP